MPIALAFSGGLDTSFCVPYLREETGEDVYTVTVDTGGFSEEEKHQIAQRSVELGAAGHTLVDARQDLWERVLNYLVKGNVLRGDVYPLCVGPERVVQAEVLFQAAQELGCTAVAHGSTGAGNDQIRFDTALRLLADAHETPMEILTPVRSLALSREASTRYLTERGFQVETETTAYSINRGLWGTTIGGKETHDTDGVLPEEAWPDTVSSANTPDSPHRFTIQFGEGVPTTIDGTSLEVVNLVEALNQQGALYGVGRGIHVGDTILGIKGRVAFEAPAALTLIAAHRELEKLVLTEAQTVQKEELGRLYGRFVHGGLFFDPVCRDIEAFLDSSQKRVSGKVTVEWFKSAIRVLGATSPFSLVDAGAARYGEDHTLWSGADAEGFSAIYGLQGRLAARVSSSPVKNTEAAVFFYQRSASIHLDR